MTRFVLAYALLRGVWYGLLGRTAFIKAGGRTFFAYGDGEHDDTRTIQRALDRASTVFPVRTFGVHGPVVVPAGRSLRGDGTILRDCKRSVTEG